VIIELDVYHESELVDWVDDCIRDDIREALDGWRVMRIDIDAADD